MSTVYTYVEIEGQSVFAGTAHTHLRHGREGSSFHYDPTYLGSEGAYALEPAMPLVSGEFPFFNGLPRSFRDASPDRWGRLLIEKTLHHAWRTSNTPPRSITEVDYLLGTSDDTRQGALRFKQYDSESFVSTGTDVPKLLALPTLLAASNELCTDTHADSVMDYGAVKTLLDAGTGSLGGARPKASVRDKDAQGNEMLCVVKFPHPADHWNVMRWERIALELAARAGIDVPPNRLLPVGKQRVLVLQRFDRGEGGTRIGYMSALTMLERDDGQTGDYLEIADILSEMSEDVTVDLEQLWRRIVFTIAINNTDDHLRNHAVLRGKRAWRLSPAFDINPNPDLSEHRVTAIAGAASFDESLKAAHEMSEWFGLSAENASRIQGEVFGAIEQWETVARINGATQDELRLFAPVFSRVKQVRKK